jgi:biofilm PGA synthesis N-glycosyltransferase PgaC
MPETLMGLWKQRLRWAMGGVQVMLKNFKVLFQPKQTHLWGLMTELLLSMIWAYSMIVVFLVWVLDKFMDLPYLMVTDSPILPNESSIILIGACLIQFYVSKWLDGHYDKGMGQNYFWMIWYPFAFWFLNLFTAVTALPKVLFMKQKRARWVSPDRGAHQQIKKVKG